MADTSFNLEVLDYHYVIKDTLYDKDTLKNQAFTRFSEKICVLYGLPAAIQVYQTALINRPEKIAQFRFWRNVKFVSLFGAVVAGYHEKMMLEKKWRYYDRIYPEPTNYQKDIVTDAQMMRERDEIGMKSELSEEDKVFDPEQKNLYKQFYQVPTQRHAG